MNLLDQLTKGHALFGLGAGFQASNLPAPDSKPTTTGPGARHGIRWM
jgi:hypothetical protein